MSRCSTPEERESRNADNKRHHDKVKDDPEFKRANYARIKARRAANPDKAKFKAEAKNQPQSEARKQYQKQYYEKNKERIIAAAKARREANLEYYRKIARDCYHRRKRAEALAEWSEK